MTAAPDAYYKKALEYSSIDFDESDPVRRAFANVVAFLIENSQKTISRLTYGMLRHAAKLSADDGEILHRTIAYLTGARANLLAVGYEFVDGDFEHILQPDEVHLFLANGEFCDPRTGIDWPDSERSIYVFFRPNYAAFH